MEITIKNSPKQDIAWDLLHDKETESVLYGGAAGGGKTYLGCSWLITACLTYPGIRCLIGRETRKDLIESTEITFKEVLQFFGLKANFHYKTNKQEFTYEFANGSVVVFRELKYLPSDPDYERLGSNPYTFAFLEEASQVTEKAYEVVKTRLRWMHDIYDLIPKVLLTCNPHKGWLYKEFYKPNKENRLSKERAFISALIQDNPNKIFVRKYVHSLSRIKDPILRARLWKGDWEYTVSDNTLCSYDAAEQMFRNWHVPHGEPALTCDVARYGENDTVIYRWSGLRMEERYIIKYSKKEDLETPSVKTANFIKVLEVMVGISRDRVIVDEDGLGSGVVDLLPGCIGFVAKSSPLTIGSKQQNYDSLKSQCAYLAGEKIDLGRVHLSIEDTELQQKILMESVAYKKIGYGEDKKAGITPKKDVKKLLDGNSPDDFDNIIMRMRLEVLPSLEADSIETSQTYPDYKKTIDSGYMDYIELDDIDGVDNYSEFEKVFGN